MSGKGPGLGDNSWSMTPEQFAKRTGLGRDYVYALCKSCIAGKCGRPIPRCEVKGRYLINTELGAEWWRDECAASAAECMAEHQHVKPLKNRRA